MQPVTCKMFRGPFPGRDCDEALVLWFADIILDTFRPGRRQRRGKLMLIRLPFPSLSFYHLINLWLWCAYLSPFAEEHVLHWVLPTHLQMSLGKGTLVFEGSWHCVFSDMSRQNEMTWNLFLLELVVHLLNSKTASHILEWLNVSSINL